MNHAAYLIMGIIGGIAAVIFECNCPISFVESMADGKDSRLFKVDMGETPSILLKGKKILAVDDEEDVVDSIEEMLETCFVDKARDFETASRLLQIKPYDAAILDLNGVDGYELLDIARSRNIRRLFLLPMPLMLIILPAPLNRVLRRICQRKNCRNSGYFLQTSYLKPGRITEKTIYGLPSWKIITIRNSETAGKTALTLRSGKNILLTDYHLIMT